MLHACSMLSGMTVTASPRTRVPMYTLSKVAPPTSSKIMTVSPSRTVQLSAPNAIALQARRTGISIRRGLDPRSGSASR